MEQHYESILKVEGALDSMLDSCSSMLDPCKVEHFHKEEPSGDKLKPKYDHGLEYFEPFEEKKCTLDSMLNSLNSKIGACQIENICEEKASAEILKPKHKLEYFEPYEENKCKNLDSLLGLYKIEEKPFGEVSKRGDKVFGEYYEPSEHYFGSLEYLLKSCKSEINIEAKPVAKASRPNDIILEDCLEPVEDVLESLLKSYDIGSLVCEEMITDEDSDSLICEEKVSDVDSEPYKTVESLDENLNFPLSEFEIFDVIAEDKMNDVQVIGNNTEFMKRKNMNEDKLHQDVYYVRKNKVRGVHLGSPVSHTALKVSSRNPVLGSFISGESEPHSSMNKVTEAPAKNPVRKIKALSIIKPKAKYHPAKTKKNRKFVKYLPIVTKRMGKKIPVGYKEIGRCFINKSDFNYTNTFDINSGSQVRIWEDGIGKQKALQERIRRKGLASYFDQLREMMSPLLSEGYISSKLTVLKTATMYVCHLKLMLEELEMDRLQTENYRKLLMDRLCFLKNGY